MRAQSRRRISSPDGAVRCHPRVSWAVLLETADGCAELRGCRLVARRQW